ncbi:MAG: adenosylcobinamide-GDP ribazoletransferase [Hyphomicrobiales bacterium]|nr:adenosylcobinamide-GDP ribazoletransferase [Hyphomicrobiales bacterium]MCP4998220.1 adenosylcobinamide-GDP ribazoletransferase [Hyphomicrobiales bacterium]
MTDLVAESARAVAFLSRLPVPDRYFENTETEIAQSARAYPLAGVVVAIPAAIVLFLLLAVGLAPLFASALAVACLIFTTGALHEDGLADCADGFWGGRDRDSILAIMKDSRIGVYGALALILMVLLRISGLAAIAAGTSAISAALALLAVAVLSRAAMVWHWHVLPAAKPDGVAASAGRPDGDAMVFAALSGGALAGVLAYAASGFAGILSMFLLAAIVCTGFSRIAREKIGGHTGDSIGATQLVCEIASLLGLALWI